MLQNDKDLRANLTISNISRSYCVSLRDICIINFDRILIDFGDRSINVYIHMYVHLRRITYILFLKRIKETRSSSLSTRRITLLRGRIYITSVTVRRERGAYQSHFFSSLSRNERSLGTLIFDSSLHVPFAARHLAGT